MATKYSADNDIVRSKKQGVLSPTASIEMQMPNRSGDAPEWFPSARTFLESMIALEENWDGYGAASPDPAILYSAIGLLEVLTSELGIKAPNISPTRTGGIIFEWESGEREMEIQLVNAEAASYVYSDRSNAVVFSGALFADDFDQKCAELLNMYFTN